MNKNLIIGLGVAAAVIGAYWYFKGKKDEDKNLTDEELCKKYKLDIKLSMDDPKSCTTTNINAARKKNGLGIL